MKVTITITITATDPVGQEERVAEELKGQIGDLMGQAEFHSNLNGVEYDYEFSIEKT